MNWQNGSISQGDFQLKDRNTPNRSQIITSGGGPLIWPHCPIQFKKKKCKH